MPTALITAQYVNQPQPGKAYGSIKCPELGYISVKPADLALFTRGQRYEIEYEEKGQYKNFARLAHSTGAPAAAPASGRDTTQARDIFITGVVGRAMGSGKFDAADIKNLAMEAHDAWKAVTAAADPSCPF